MNKPWVGFLSSALLLAAGIVYLAGGRTGLGALFLLLAAASTVLNIYIAKKLRK